MSEEIFKEEKYFTQHDVENKQLKEENEKLRKENEKIRNENENENETENENENEQLRKDKEDANIKELIEKPKEIKSPKEDKNTTDYYPNCFDKNKFKKFLTIIDSDKFSYKNKIGEFKYTDVKNLDNNIKNNTISEVSAKEGLNTLKEIKKHRNNKI